PHPPLGRPQGAPKLLADNLRQGRAGVLSDLHFAGVDCDGAVLADVQPGADLLRRGWTRSAPAASSLFLRACLRDHRDDDNTASQQLEKLAAVEVESIRGTCQQLVA